jgi:hypothetical protein
MTSIITVENLSKKYINSIERYTALRDVLANGVKRTRKLPEWHFWLVMSTTCPWSIFWPGEELTLGQAPSFGCLL